MPTGSPTPSGTSSEDEEGWCRHPGPKGCCSRTWARSRSRQDESEHEHKAIVPSCWASSSDVGPDSGNNKSSSALSTTTPLLFGGVFDFFRSRHFRHRRRDPDHQWLPGRATAHRPSSLVLLVLLSQCLFILPSSSEARTILNAGNPDAKRLYDDLLSNYNKLVRPVVNTTDPLTVRIKLKLSQLIDVVSE